MSVDISVEVKDYPKISRDLERFIRDFPEVAGLADWLKKERLKLARTPYPPELPGQRYRRTGVFGASWRARVFRDGGQLINIARYASDVTGSPDAPSGERQAKIHQGRWWIAKEEVEADLPKLVASLEGRYIAEFEEVFD